MKSSCQRALVDPPFSGLSTSLKKNFGPQGGRRDGTLERGELRSLHRDDRWSFLTSFSPMATLTLWTFGYGSKFSPGIGPRVLSPCFQSPGLPDF